MAKTIVTAEVIETTVSHLERFMRLTRVYSMALKSHDDQIAKDIGVELDELTNDIDVAREQLAAEVTHG